MNSRKTESSVHAKPSAAETGERLQRVSVFVRWCFQRETLSLWNCLVTIFPVMVAGYFSQFALGYYSPWQGTHLLRTLLWVAAFFIFVGGMRHASKAVCWEVSRELRDLVRLTGIDPRTLLWCKSLSRWWTISLSVLVILPLAMFARTLGATSFDQWFSGGCWLLLLIALTAGFAMIASVTSNQVSNPETMAATSTFLLMAMYHVMFWVCSAVIGMTLWFSRGTFDLPVGSFGRQAIQFVLSLSPAAGLYRGLTSPSTFSPLDVTYWPHFVTAGFCVLAASKVMRNRFRVTTRGEDGPSESIANKHSVVPNPRLRPRFSDRPFYWKDTYILGGGNWSKSWWTAISLLATVGVFSALVYKIPAVVIAVVAVCAAPCLLAIRFDALLVPEFRDQTWGSLMLLPVNPNIFLLEKLRAAASERIAILLPVGVAAAIGMVSSPAVILMAATVAMLVGVLMIEISIVNQLYVKTWWIGLVVAGITIGLIAFLVPVWLFFGYGLGFFVTLVILAIVIFGFLSRIQDRLKNWSDAS
jgi:hypothetical protein